MTEYIPIRSKVVDIKLPKGESSTLDFGEEVSALQYLLVLTTAEVTLEAGEKHWQVTATRPLELNAQRLSSVPQRGWTVTNDGREDARVSVHVHFVSEDQQ